MKPYAQFAGLFLLLILSGTGCSKHKDQNPLGAGLFLSCDLAPDQWYPFRTFLKNNHIKVTFYTESFDKFTDAQKTMAHEMVADGHEIAHHTATHPNLEEYLKSHTLDEYMNNEIIPIQNMMQTEGFECKTFAYPYGVSTKECDQALLKRFTSIRKLYNPSLLKKLEDVSPIYYRYGNNEILVAASIDKTSKLSVSEITNALEKAKKSKQTISLYCHNIGFSDQDAGQYSINESDLKAILNKAVELDLKSYTATEISRAE